MRLRLTSCLSWVKISTVMLILFLLFGQVTSASAMDRTQATGTLSFKLGDIARGESLVMQGPYDSLGLSFILPQTQAVAGDAILRLKVQVTLATFVIGGGTPPDLTNAEAGRVTLFLNDTELQKISIIGEKGIETEVHIPQSAFAASGESNHLRLDLDAGQVCTNNLSITLALADESSIELPVSTEGVRWDLSAYPEMFYQPAAIIQPPLVVVVSDDASLVEPNAAANIIAGLSRLTHGHLRASLQPLSAVGEAAKVESNFIILGDASLFADLAPELTGNIDWPKAGSDAAALKLMAFPWNTERVVLLGQAQTSAGWSNLVAALTMPALADASGADFTTINAAPQSQAMAEYQPVRSLSSLSQGDLIFDRPGTLQREIQLDLPYGSTVSPQSYFDIIVNFSDALDYTKTSLMVEVNNTPVATLSLAGEAGRDQTNRLLLPARVFQPGKNVVTFKAELAARDICADFKASGLHLTVRGASVLNLPVVYQSRPHVQSTRLSEFANLYASEPLSKTQILFPNGEQSLWPAIADLAATLGSKSADHAPFTLNDISNLTQVLAGGSNLIAIGLLSDTASVQALSTVLPLPLGNDGLPAIAGQVPADLRISSDRLPAYIEVSQAGRPQTGTILSVLGPDVMSVSSAVAAVMAPASQAELAKGNVAIIHESDMRVFQTKAAGSTEVIEVQPVARPSWLLPLILIAFTGFLALVVSGLKFKNK